MKFGKRAAKYDTEIEGKISQKVYQLVMDSVEVNSGDKILDLGCGTGTILYRLDHLYHIEGYGIDIEEKMIEQTKIKCPQMNIQYGDCSKTSFQDEMFDSLIACMTFHHFHDQKVFAEETSRILKTGGKLYLADPCFPDLIRKLINYIIQQRNLVGKFCTEQEVIQIFKPFGLEVKEKKKDGFFQVIILEKVCR